MTTVASAWDSHPGYRIQVIPYQGTARVWHNELLLAESTQAIRVIETDHVERLYFPERDVRLDLLSENDHHSVCPFKGEADYWSLSSVPSPAEDVFWVYRTTFGQVEGLRGYLGVYHEKLRVELVSTWADDPRALSINAFPAWGDQSDLLALIDVQETGPNQFSAPGYHVNSRNVVEGGQLLAQAIVAASKAMPEQRVISATMTFPKAASFDDPHRVGSGSTAKGPYLLVGRSSGSSERGTGESRLAADGLGRPRCNQGCDSHAKRPRTL
jgi:acyl-CoA thioesterase-2